MTFASVDIEVIFMTKLIKGVFMENKKRIGIIRKKEKTPEDTRKFAEVQVNDIVLDRPIVICFGGSGATIPGAAYGFGTQIERRLGIHETPFEEMPCAVYSVYYPTSLDGEKSYNGKSADVDFFESLNDEEIMDLGKYTKEEQDNILCVMDFATDLVDNVLTQLVVDENGEKISVEQAMRNARNVNFVNYCYGSNVQLAVNTFFHKKLVALGYTKEEAAQIESQMCVFQVGPYVEESKTNQTTVNFISLNDNALNDKPMQKTLKNKKGKEIVGDVTSTEGNETIVYVNGLTKDEFGEEHYAMYYFRTVEDGLNKDDIVGDVLAASLTVCLKKSIINAYTNGKNGKKFKPITPESFKEPCAKIMKMANNEKSSQKIAKKFTPKKPFLVKNK